MTGNGVEPPKIGGVTATSCGVTANDFVNERDPLIDKDDPLGFYRNFISEKVGVQKFEPYLVKEYN